MVVVFSPWWAGEPNRKESSSPTSLEKEHETRCPTKKPKTQQKQQQQQTQASISNSIVSHSISTPPRHQILSLQKIGIILPTSHLLLFSETHSKLYIGKS
jgi:hypothetical protein